MKRSATLCAAIAALVLTADCASAKSIHYDASKSNTGNVTAHKGIGMTSGSHDSNPPSMAVKNGGVPQNTSTKTGPSSPKTQVEPSHMEMPNFGR